jgi:hypothetical protein
MSVLPAGQRLNNFLPDLDELLHDPRGYLQHPVVIGPRRMYRLALLFAIPGVAFLVSCIPYGAGDGERPAMGAGFLVGASIWFFWSLFLRGHALVLHPDGVEVKYRDTTVWCPWALFHADGEPFVPRTDSPRLGLTLPVVREAIPFVELRRRDTPIAFGAQACGPQFRFHGDQVVLPARYQVMAEDLGQLLLALGQRLGSELPRGAPPREAYETAGLGALHLEPDAAGWFTVPLSLLEFPRICAQCGEETDQKAELPVGARGGWFLALFVPQARPLRVAVPLCEDCQHELAAKVQRATFASTLVGMVIGCVLAWALIVADRPSLRVPAVIGGLALGGLFGYVLGLVLGFRPPVRLKNFAPAGGTVCVHCQSPNYAAMVIERTEARSRRR